MFEVFVCLIYWGSNLCRFQTVERMCYTSMLDVCLQVNTGDIITNNKNYWCSWEMTEEDSGTFNCEGI